MAGIGSVSWGRREKMDGGFGDFRPSDSEEVHVLAVDDSLVDRKVIERLLKITSCKVTAVDSGVRALQFLGLDKEQSNTLSDGLKVDLIITDYCMPEMTGYELLKKIKGSTTFRQIPVVVMSSENVLTRIDRCLEEGAEDFIVKPVKLSDVERLKDYMRKDVRVASGNKRKQRDHCDLDSSPPSTSPSPSSSSLSISPSISPSPSEQSLSAPSSPSSSDSLNRKLKTKIAD